MRKLLHTIAVKAFYLLVQAEFKASGLPRHIKYSVLDKAYALYGKRRYTTVEGLKFISRSLRELDKKSLSY